MARLLERLRGRELTSQERENLGEIEREICTPIAVWSLISIVLFCLLASTEWRFVGEAMLALALYLVYGAMKIRRAGREKLHAIEELLRGRQILFRTDMGRKIARQCVVIFSVTAIFFSCLVIMNAAVWKVPLWGRFLLAWGRASTELKVDLLAILFSALMSAVVIVLGILRVAQMSNIIITDDGLLISDSFFSWKEIQAAHVEYFFGRPVDLVVETCGGSRIRIQLSRFHIGREKADELVTLINARSRHS
ncbi:MAG: hypothetical protein RDV48_03355 [Candidatus Eremiobacteraeota bacterium]|nr:hypothetical protein [Candidatus Eremiobacteraeota bacterium]